MMAKRSWSLWVGLILGSLLAVAGIGADRMGGWVDEIVFSEEPSSAAGILKLANNQSDVFAFSIADPVLLAQVQANPDLDYVLSLGSYNELTLNPAGPVFDGTGKLNPFAVARIREAMNYLIDRDYLSDEICGGLAYPRFTCISGNFAEAIERVPETIAEVAETYAYNPTLGEQMITEEMEKLGAVKLDGKWQYEGEPVELIFLIRTEDERREMGIYIAGLLENLGFTVVQQLRTNAELSPIWMRGDPNAGEWHLYTGGWVTTVIPRTEADNFAFFDTPIYMPYPLWQNYKNDPAYFELAEDLWNYVYADMEERKSMIEEALWLHMAESQHVWLVDRGGFSAFRANVNLAADTAGGIYGSQMWALTAHFEDENGLPAAGGSLRVEMPSMLPEPWNPVAGTNFIYDMMPIRATGDYGYGRDTRTGLIYPSRFERAEIVAVEGTPVSTSSDWCTLTFVPEIQVPADAWYDWDPVAQRFITVGEVFPEGLTAVRKSVVYYPSDLYDVKLHDGSTISIADFVMNIILTFDRAKPESAIYDAAAVPEFESFMEVHKGYRIVSRDPLIMESYSDSCNLDAELSITTFFPYYSQGPGFWHVLTLGIMAETDKRLAFSAGKAEEIGATCEWMSLVAGPSLPILAEYILEAFQTGYIPYEPTLGEYLTKAEAINRWTLLENWYKNKGHFWVGSGPYYLEKVLPVEKGIILKRHPEFPDPADRWLFLLEEI